jgi:hypothetical protein
MFGFVTGLGPVSLLADLKLRLRGDRVYRLDIVDTASTRAKWLENFGGYHLDGR